MLDFASLFFPSEARTRMGRPRSSDVPHERLLHLKVLEKQIEGMSIRETAQRLGISRRTVAYYRQRARTYPEADAIIRLARAN